MAVSEKIQNLRALIGEKEGIEKKEFLFSSSFNQGVPRGSIIELSGYSSTSWIVQFLKENKGLKIFWLEEKQRVFPTAMSQRGVSLSRIVFGVIEKELFPTIRKVIQSQAFEVVIAPSSFKELKILKALQLLTEKSNTILFLLTKEHRIAWPISMQLEINSSILDKSCFDITVLKNKYAAVL
jgi:hypothetical protein